MKNPLAGRTQRLAFTTTTVSTLGLGDVVPTTHPGRVVTGIASLTGIGIITLSVTYVLPVVTSVSDRRRQAMSIHAMGSSTASLVQSLDDPDVATPFLRQATQVSLSLSGTAAAGIVVRR